MAQRVAAITGGARGIGKAVALALAERGWNVSLAYRTRRTSARQEALDTAQAIQSHRVEGLAFERDVSDPEQARSFIQETERRLGHLDALIHAAGPYHRVPLLEETGEAWREAFDSNLHALFYLAQAAAGGMQQRRWGRIVTFGIVNADRLTAQPNVTAYTIAKTGVLVLTRTLARILAPYGVTANTVSPGFIDTGSADVDREYLQDMSRTIPAGYLGAPEDAVQATLFLLSDEASYINGANIAVSGGWGV